MLLIVLACMAGCRSGNRKPPDVSGIPMQVHIDRFDREFMALDSMHVSAGLSDLYARYRTFLPVYLEHILNFGPYEDTSQLQAAEIRNFITARDIRQLQDTVNAHFPNMDDVAAQLRQGFRYIKYYFPQFRPPRVVTFISGLANYGAITADSVLGIGLDMFLGPEFAPYGQVADPYPGYMLYQFTKPYIAADCFKVIQQEMFPMPAGGTLLDQMIARGKQLYFLDRVMPDTPDSLKAGFTGTQLSWCQDNAQAIWQYFIQGNLLYIHDMQRIMHYIGPGPGTQGMPAPAPGDIGSWVGWQIVRKYMEEHPETTLEMLMSLRDSQALLSESRYRPH
jgi:hypothetical protein